MTDKFFDEETKIYIIKTLAMSDNKNHITYVNFLKSLEDHNYSYNSYSFVNILIESEIDANLFKEYIHITEDIERNLKIKLARHQFYTDQINKLLAMKIKD